MKLQKLKNSGENNIYQHGFINRAIKENLRLRDELLEATDKQHQEMSRAIELKEKNVHLRTEIHDAKIQAKNKRIEASRHAKKLAEANYFLEKCLQEVCNEINGMKREIKYLNTKEEKISSVVL
ncbi:hypothetical protein HF086_009858 [Spodoptera exigua]|uniref:Uncharacterized protein n=1 Tax=Spodoptera exigua TaxID=7107 RepID=A0A922S994_SPOEX|nr:hypothetical protein HF086_009858 [Spodoptera exigua]